MPEVCEVCLTAHFLSSFIGDSIMSIKIIGGRYTKNKMKMDNVKFPLKIKHVQSKGKFLWFTTKHDDEKYYILNTFGLTGKWSTENLCDSNDISSGFGCIQFKMMKKDGKKYKLYFSDMRNFGTLEITTDNNKLQTKLNKLAPDLLQENFTYNDLEKRFDMIKNKNKKIVVVLMSQDKTGIGSGLGNYLVPEILYDAKISPHRTIKSLSTDDVKKLTKSIKKILRWCYVANSTDYITHISSFLKKHTKLIESGVFPNFYSDIKLPSKKFSFRVYRQKLDTLGNKIKGDKIIGSRTTYWSPTIQS